MKLVYSDGFDLNLGNHVFPSAKYRWVRDRILADALFPSSDFVEPLPARDDDIGRVHSRNYYTRLKSGGLSSEEIVRLEIPYSRELVDAIWLGVGGTIAACRHALADGAGATIGGGYHHAFPEHGEGFCALNDVAVAIRTLQHEGAIQTAMTVDCDVHHGNGTAAIFAGDSTVFTFSIHQLNNYPFHKPASDLDIHLEDRTRDDAYLDELSWALNKSLESFRPDIIVYLAGADPFKEDQLGGLSLSIHGLRCRDRLVFQAARKMNIPLAVTLAGGYAFDVEDTVRIHCNTLSEAREIFDPPQSSNP